MKAIAIILGVIAVAGCGPGAAHKSDATRDVRPSITTASDAERDLLERYRGLKPAHQAQVREYEVKYEREEIRQGAWKRNLLIAAVGLGSVALLAGLMKLLGAL